MIRAAFRRLGHDEVHCARFNAPFQVGHGAKVEDSAFLPILFGGPNFMEAVRRAVPSPPSPPLLRPLTES